MRNRGFFLASSFLIVLFSQLTAYRIFPGPDVLGLFLAFCSLFIIPGILLTIWISGSVESTIEGSARVFFGGLVYSIAISSVGFIPGAGFKTISTVHAVAVTAWIALTGLRYAREMRSPKEPGGIRFASSRDPEKTEHKAMLFIILLMFAICFVLFYETGELGVATDAPDHLSFVRRALDSNHILPADSFYRGGDGTSLDPRKGMWHPVMSLWAFQADSPAEKMWVMIPSFIVIFMLAAYWAFAKEILGSTFLTILAGILTLMFIRGEGLIWLTKTAYSKNLSQGMMWISFASLLRCRRTGESAGLVFASVIALAASAVHPVSAMWIITALSGFVIYLAIWERKELSRWSLAAAIVAAASVLPVLVRLYTVHGEANWLHMHPQGLLTLGRRLVMVDPVEIISSSGLVTFFAVLAGPAAFMSKRFSKEGKLAATMFYLPVLLVMNPLSGTLLESRLGYLHYRILYAAPMMCVLVIAFQVMLSRLFSGWRSTDGKQGRRTWNAIKWAVSAVMLFIFAAVPLRFAIRTDQHDIRGILAARNTEADRAHAMFDDLLSGVDEHSVIVSDPVTSYMLSAFTDHFVAVCPGQHGSPMDSLAFYRLERTRDIFSPAVPMYKSAGWLREINADYVLVNTASDDEGDFFRVVIPGEARMSLEKFRECPSLMTESVSGRGMWLFRVSRPDSIDMGALCSNVLESPDTCTGPKGSAVIGKRAAEGLLASEVYLSEGSVAPGDTLSGVICWQTETAQQFGLPFEFTLRFDTAFPKGPFFRKWYGKQYRRIIERRKGEFYRFTCTGRIRSGSSFPDQWESGAGMRQTFRFRVPAEMAPGKYTVTLAIRRASYLPNRTVADYLRNDDSYSGMPVSVLTILGTGAEGRITQKVSGE